MLKHLPFNHIIIIITTDINITITKITYVLHYFCLGKRANNTINWRGKVVFEKDFQLSKTKAFYRHRRFITISTAVQIWRHWTRSISLQNIFKRLFNIVILSRASPVECLILQFSKFPGILNVPLVKFSAWIECSKNECKIKHSDTAMKDTKW